MITVSLTGLAKIELPGTTVRLCDGGFIVWGGETYRSHHPVFGAIGSIEALGDGLGDQVPALQMVMYPAADAAAADLSRPGFQQARARFWIGNYNPETGALVGTPELMFDGFVDLTTLKVGRSSRELAISIVDMLERLFELNIGNSLNPVWHKSVWPGETGHDNATALVRQVAWGVEAPVSSGFSRGFGGFGGFGRGGFGDYSSPAAF